MPVIQTVLLAAYMMIAVGVMPAAAQAFDPTGVLGQGTAADEPAAAAPPLEQRVDALVEALNDPEIQAWLRQQVAAPTLADSGTSVVGDKIDRLEMGANAWVSAQASMIRETTQARMEAVAEAPSEWQRFTLIWGLEVGEQGTLRGLLLIALFATVGTLAELTFKRMTQGLRDRVFNDTCDTPRARLTVAGLRALRDGGSLVVFTLGSMGVFLILDAPPLLQLFVLNGLGVFVAYRIAVILSAALYAPRLARLRLIAVSDSRAWFLYRWTVAILTVGAFGVLLADLLAQLGLTPNILTLVWEGTWLVVVAMLVLAAWRSVRYADTPEERALERRWALVSTFVWPGIWVLYLIGAEGVATLLVVALALPLVPRLCCMIVRRAVLGPAEAEAGATRPLPLPAVAVDAVMRALLILGLALALLAGFGIPPDMLASGNAPAIAPAAIDILLTLLAADILWRMTQAWISARLAAEGGEDMVAPGEEGGSGPASRSKTLLPLLRNVVLGLLGSITVLLVLSNLGVEIGPLLAGAGVVGIAVGFGAQTLVRDIFSGVFFLVDDAFRVGEYIEVGTEKGTVEGLSIRSMSLRHHLGAVHTIPYGEIQSVTNHSRDWVVMRLEFNMPFDTDVELVKRVVKQVGKELAKDPTHGPSLLVPPKSQGIRRIEEFNMVVGVKFMTRPGEQWLVRRDAYTRLLQAFEDNGIRLARREVRIAAPPGVEIDDSTLQAAGEVSFPTGPVPATTG